MKACPSTGSAPDGSRHCCRSGFHGRFGSARQGKADPRRAAAKPQQTGNIHSKGSNHGQVLCERALDRSRPVSDLSGSHWPCLVMANRTMPGASGCRTSHPGSGELPAALCPGSPHRCLLGLGVVPAPPGARHPSDRPSAKVAAMERSEICGDESLSHPRAPVSIFLLKTP